MPKETVQWGSPFIAKPGEDGTWFSFDTTPYSEVTDLGTGQTESLPEGVIVSRENHLDLVWSRAGEYGARPRGEDPEGSVQLVLDVDSAEFKNLYLRQETSDASVRVYSKKLTRHQINTLIKLLKRSRDAAYGADE
jgi:hypothetical protein